MVTGAASGIGAGLASHLVSLGDRVIALDMDRNGLTALADRLASPNLMLALADVTDDAQVERALVESTARFGHPEVLVNNAGTTGGPQATTLHETPPDVVDRVVNVNLRAVIRLTAAVLPAMLERRRGVIVNIASVAGLVAFPARAAYSITKAAVIQVTRTIAVDYGHQGIRSIALCPGIIDTPMTHWRLAQPALREEVLARIPQRTIGTVSDVVGAAAFFASDEASYCNGAAIPVDGGYLAI
ncbi:MAG: SDR family oxidoreductase [Pseudomonadota bacterium]|nr:SDR family oxidoreductase [Pseudomonadota bacterium]